MVKKRCGDFCSKSGKVCPCVSIEGWVMIDGPVEISNFPDQIDVVKSHFCDTDTNTHFECIKIFINWVLDSETNTDTWVPCTEPVPQSVEPEKVQYCNLDTGTLWTKVCVFTTTFDDDWLVTGTTEDILSETDSNIPCVAPDKKLILECRGWLKSLVLYQVEDDNSLTELSVTVTEEECNTPQYDYELRDECINGTIHQQLVKLDSLDDSEVNIGTPVDTGVTCGKQEVEVKDCEWNDVTVEVDQVVKLEWVIQAKLCPEDKVEVDVEYFCDSTSEFIQESITTTTNGIPVTVVNATTYKCEDYILDFEKVVICDSVTKTKHIVTSVFDRDENEVVIWDVDTWEECCQWTPECVESQEWTYGIDNTGTNFAEDNTIQVNLSDGSSFIFNQPPATGWTPQMQVWWDEIQTAADANGIAWFVETRYRDPSNPANLAWGGWFAWPPSVAVSNALTNMAWRYVNIQICPWQPVPVSAEIIDSSNPARIGFQLTSDGAVLWPIQKFIICRCCGEAPVWYLDDGVTLAAAGQIPNCYEPCGTLSLVSSPPDRDCTFQINVACDNNNSTNTVDFTNTITRRATVCNGEQIAVDYFQQDPNDPNALVDYTLVWDFVDCATGEPVELPVPECTNFEIVKLHKLENVVDGLIQSEYETGIAPATAWEQWDDELAWIDMDAVDITTATVITAPTIVTGSLQTNDTNNSAWVQDIEYREGYIIVTQPTTVRWTTNSEWALRVELGKCCGGLEEQFTYAKTVWVWNTPVVEIWVGIHKIKMTNLDFGASNSSWNAQITSDGINWVTDNTPPGMSFSTVKPQEVCEHIKICEDTWAFIGLIDGAVKTPSDYYDCKIECDNTQNLANAIAAAIIGDDECPCNSEDIVRCDYSLIWSEANVTEIVTDAWNIVWPWFLPTGIVAMQSAIQSFLDANGWGSTNIVYDTNNNWTFEITSSAVVFTQATGQWAFTQSNCS